MTRFKVGDKIEILDYPGIIGEIIWLNPNDKTSFCARLNKETIKKPPYYYVGWPLVEDHNVRHLAQSPNDLGWYVNNTNIKLLGPRTLKQILMDEFNV